MSAQAAVFSGFRPKIKRSMPQQSIQVSFLDAGSWVGEVLQMLAELEALPANWDSYGSAPPQPAALHRARQFLARAPVARVPAPTVTAVPGGGVGFHWRVEERDLEIEFLPNADAEFLKSGRAGKTPGEEGSLIGPDDERELLNWLVGF